MTALRERERVSAPVMETTSYSAEWLFGSIGTLAALIGTWLYYGPADGTLSLFRWDWEVAGMHEAWPFSLIIGGGVLLALAFGMLTSKFYRRDEAMTTSVVISGLLGLAALGGAITYLLIWIF